ncbi:hypothetical protein SDC9_96266 [bioreactor metagenome]|uniref:Uncharacterized protein n=1 Tax=bioreactor metagenome TaxID=1076179 RepID=A0A645A9F4_9ZZZZ
MSSEVLSKLLSGSAGLVSIMAIFISVYNSVITRRRLIAEAISKNRIEWIRDVRELVTSFLLNYDLGNLTEEKAIFYKLSLYMSTKNSDYKELLGALEECISDDKPKDKHRRDVISSAQVVLTQVWIRMKREAGIDRVSEARFLRKLRKEFEENKL